MAGIIVLWKFLVCLTAADLSLFNYQAHPLQKIQYILSNSLGKWLNLTKHCFSEKECTPSFLTKYNALKSLLKKSDVCLQIPFRGFALKNVFFIWYHAVYYCNVKTLTAKSVALFGLLSTWKYYISNTQSNYLSALPSDLVLPLSTTSLTKNCNLQQELKFRSIFPDLWQWIFYLFIY